MEADKTTEEPPEQVHPVIVQLMQDTKTNTPESAYIKIADELDRLRKRVAGLLAFVKTY